MKYFCPKCDRRSDEDGICPDDGCDFLPYDDRDPFVGRVIDERFEVRAKLGEGGMGAVYMAHQRSVDRPVVLKVLRRELQDHPSVVRRFLLEAKAASRLTNAHTITIFDFGKTRDGVLYIAMEYLEGRSLSEKLKDQGSLSVEETVRILDKVAESLAEAHAQGIIHRDIKPDNVFLAVRPEDPEFVKVLDFGIARATSLAGEQAITRTGTIQGTPTYVSPEAVVGEKVDERADVYALGVMMYEMLTGQPPYTAETTMSLLMQHVNSEPAPLEEVNPEVEVPWPIEELIWSCLAKSRDRRPPDARGFRMALIEAMSQADDPDTEMKIPIQETGEGFKVSEEELTMITTQEREIPRSLTPSGAVARSTPGAATPAVIVEAAPVSPWPWIMLAGGALIVLSVVAWWVLSVRGGERQRSTAAEVSAQASPSALADVTDDAPLITRTARPDLPRDGTEVAGAPGADQRGPRYHHHGAGREPVRHLVDLFQAARGSGDRGRRREGHDAVGGALASG